VLAGTIGAAATATMSDQVYPAINGNNVYFTESPAGGPFNTAWLGNASGATADMSATTLDTTFYGTFNPDFSQTECGSRLARARLVQFRRLRRRLTC
jgi:hypothetical protein